MIHSLGASLGEAPTFLLSIRFSSAKISGPILVEAPPRSSNEFFLMSAFQSTGQSDRLIDSQPYRHRQVDNTVRSQNHHSRNPWVMMLGMKQPAQSPGSAR